MIYPTIILDFETSGLNPYHDDIIEVAMKVMDSEETYTSLLYPKSNECITEEITSLTGITNKDLKLNGSPWKMVYEYINDWLFSIKGTNEKIVIVSHNGESFDFIFLRRIMSDLKDLGIKTFPLHRIIFIDTLLLAKRLFSNRISYRQTSLCGKYQISSEGCHRAMNDVIALERLFRKLLQALDTQLNKRKSVFDKPEMIENYIRLNYLL